VPQHLQKFGPQPTVQTASRPRTSQSSRALGHSPRVTHFCGGLRTSPAGWQHLAPRWPTFAPAPGTAAQATDPPPEMTLHPPCAGTIATTELRHKGVLSPVPTGSMKTQHSGQQRQHTFALQPQDASSSRTGSVNGDSLSTWVQTSA
jgi:hypothetical protein